MKVRVTGAPLEAAPDAAGVAPDGADAVVAAGAIAGAPVPGVPGGEQAAEHAATSAPAPAATDINRCRRESVRVAGTTTAFFIASSLPSSGFNRAAPRRPGAARRAAGGKICR